MTYSLEELTDMNDRDFHRAVVDDMIATTQGQGPFQDSSLIERTLLQLTEWLWATNSKIEERAGDPDCATELYEKTVKFRNHLLGAIEVTDRRIGWMHGAKERTLRQWRAVLDEVVSAIIDGRDDDEILAIRIPSFDKMNKGDGYDLETWHEIRRAKDPERYERMKAAA